MYPQITQFETHRLEAGSALRSRGGSVVSRLVRGLAGALSAVVHPGAG